jgi:hypothetical protein
MMLEYKILNFSFIFFIINLFFFFFFRVFSGIFNGRYIRVFYINNKIFLPTSKKEWSLSEEEKDNIIKIICK